jgi:hypothetical protein
MTGINRPPTEAKWLPMIDPAARPTAFPFFPPIALPILPPAYLPAAAPASPANFATTPILEEPEMTSYNYKSVLPMTQATF